MIRLAIEMAEEEREIRVRRVSARPSEGLAAGLEEQREARLREEGAKRQIAESKDS